MHSKTAYKGFSIDDNNVLDCRGFKFEVGKEYKTSGNLEMCENGFHFCWNLNDVHNYYNLGLSVICEVEILGDIINEPDMSKSCTNHIKIVRLLTKEEVLRISNTGRDNTGYINSGDWNTGNRNTGDCNTGNRNTGNRNTGDWNTGNRNTGDWNTGNRNTGDWNTGDCNTGDWNTGNRNTGDWNTGNRNTGDWNGSDYNTGFFNTKENEVYVFNKPSGMTTKEFKNSKYYDALTEWYPILTEWIWYTNEEKASDKAKELIGGYLKHYDYKKAHKTWWEKLSNSSKQIIQQIPGFDAEIFEQITGIKVGE